jgi:hypothetical protein
MTPAVKTLAENLYVDLIGRTMFASGSPVTPDADKLARFCVKLAESFERVTKLMDVEDDPNRPVKFDVQLDDLASWDVKK